MDRLIWLVVLLLFIDSSCKKTPEENFAPKLVLHCLLHPGESYVRAKVNRSYRIDEPFDHNFPDAKIKIFSGKGEWGFKNIAGDSYITLSPLLVQEGDTWYIQVMSEEFDPVFGKTVVPGDFNIQYPQPNDTVSMNDSMVWTRSGNCKGYFLSFRHIESLDTFYWDLVYPNDSFSANYDSARVHIPRMFFLLLVTPPRDSPPKPCTLRVWALDTNYYHWVGANGFVAGGQLVSDTSYLIGGLGVFGSAVERSVPVFVRSDTTASPVKSPKTDPSPATVKKSD